jgi:hypothetical protein
MVDRTLCWLRGASWRHISLPGVVANDLFVDGGGCIAAVFIPDTNQNGFSFTCNEDILLFVDGNTIFSENGDGFVVSSFADRHNGVRKVLEGVCLGRLLGELFER